MSCNTLGGKQYKLLHIAYMYKLAASASPPPPLPLLFSILHLHFPPPQTPSQHVLGLFAVNLNTQVFAWLFTIINSLQVGGRFADK